VQALSSLTDSLVTESFEFPFLAGINPGGDLIFESLAELLSTVCKDYPDTVWYYGTVYDPEDGTTPLEWWLEFKDQE